MKKKKNIFPVFFLILATLTMSMSLTSCGQTASSTQNILVMVEEGEGFEVLNNGQKVQPGSTVSFTLQTSSDLNIISCNYDKEFKLSNSGTKTTLTLENVTYPTRLQLSLSSKVCNITYEPNGGTSLAGEKTAVEKRYSMINHLRPNVSIGSDLFIRKGYTLVSWNTKADGSGLRVGLGSRITSQIGGITLYAQWAKWTDASFFNWVEEDGAVSIIGYLGNDDQLVIPSQINQMPVTKISTNAFSEINASSVILSPSLVTIEEGAFLGAQMRELILYDNITNFSDASFQDCKELQTLYINAVEPPFGYVYRKESCYADKIDLLILAEGQKKLICYGGCSMWYNLDGKLMDQAFGSQYRILNMGINGTVSSMVQMQIMAHYVEEGDILFHTPELASVPQLMLTNQMVHHDTTLWCGIENNYDLFSLVDMRTITGVFDTLHRYLDKKVTATDYNQFFSDDYKNQYLDFYGGINLYRSKAEEDLVDNVTINPAFEGEGKLTTLGSYYEYYRSLGVEVYVSHACTNLDALPEEEYELIGIANDIFAEEIYQYTGHYPVSSLDEFLYHNEDFYDTNYHLLSVPAMENTKIWIQDLKQQLLMDGLWKEETNERG